MENDEIRRLVYRGFEVTTCDYKRSIPWDKTNKHQLIKDILAFANAGGGHIVIGIDEDQLDTKNQRTGISPTHKDTWDSTNVNRDINKCCAPSLDVDLIQYTDDKEEKSYIILKIPCHGSSPHICTVDKHDSKQNMVLRRAGLYYRTKNKACEEICDPMDMHQLMTRCIVNRRQELLTAIEKIMEGRLASPSVQWSHESLQSLLDERNQVTKQLNQLTNPEFVYQEFLCIPLNHSVVVTPTTAKATLADVSFDYGLGWPFVFCSDRLKCRPTFAEDRIYSVSCDINEDWDPSFYYWELKYDGCFFSKRLIRESLTNVPRAFNPEWQCKIIGEAVLTMGMLYDRLGVPLNQELQLAIRYTSLAGNKPIFNQVIFERAYSSTLHYTGVSLPHQVAVRLSDCIGGAPQLASTIIVEMLEKLGAQRFPQHSFFEKIVATHLENGQRIP